jgi:hypothetical protein
MKKPISDQPDVMWNQYPRLEPGDYPAFCKKASWYQDPGYKRWTCLLLFDVLAANLNDSLGIVHLWFNGGDGDTPHASRRGLYLPEWLRATIACRQRYSAGAWHKYGLATRKGSFPIPWYARS